MLEIYKKKLGIFPKNPKRVRFRVRVHLRLGLELVRVRVGVMVGLNKTKFFVKSYKV